MTLAGGLVKVMYISIIFCCIYCFGWFVLFKVLSGYFLLPFSGRGRIFGSAFGYRVLHDLADIILQILRGAQIFFINDFLFALHN